MNLVGKSRVLSYIEKEPNAKAYILAWMKSFTEKEEINYLRSRHHGTYYCTSAPGRGEYIIRYMYNGELKFGVIDFVGDKHELAELLEKERIMMIAKHGDQEFVQETSTWIGGKEKTTSSPVSLSVDELNMGRRYLKEEIEHPYASFKYSPDFVISTSRHYEMALYRLINILKIDSESSNLKEASALIPLLKEYENKHF